jgi:hypothetical protein
LFIVVSGLVLLLLDGSTFYVATGRRKQQQMQERSRLFIIASTRCHWRVNQAVEIALKNGADNPPQVVLNPSAGSVMVTATVQKDIFFPRLVGISQVAPHAVAEVFCNLPEAAGAQP